MLTPSAARFVGPLSFRALSRHPVETDLLDLLPDGRIGHIVLGDTADAIVVAPATAHWLGAMANGLAGDVVTATCLATAAPVVVAPAMDGDMWTHPATRANVARLRDGFGYTIVEPEAGPLASGQSGVGRLAELAAIVDAVVAAVGRAPGPGRRPGGPAAARRAGARRGPGGPAHRRDRRAARARPSTRSGSSATARPAGWASPSPRAALDRGARVTLVAAHLEVPLPEADALTVVPVELDRRPRARRWPHGDRRRPASTPSSWPRPSRTSGRPTRDGPQARARRRR